MAMEGNNMDIEVAATNPVIVTNTPTSNHGIGADKVFLRPPVTNTGGVIEEEQVCWLCGGTPCDWLDIRPNYSRKSIISSPQMSMVTELTRHPMK
jgi:hypothetical protein